MYAFAPLSAWPVATASAGDASFPGAAVFFDPATGLVFPAFSAAGGRELWSVPPDGGAPAPAWELVPGPDGSEPDEMAVLSGWATGGDPALLFVAQTGAGAARALHAWIGGAGGQRCTVRLSTPLEALRRPVSTANGVFLVGTPVGVDSSPRVWRLPRASLAAGALCDPHAPVAMSQPTPAEPLSRLEHCAGEVLFLGRALPGDATSSAVGLWRLAADGSGAAFTPLPASAQPALAADGQLLANPRCMLGGTAAAFATAAGPVALVALTRNGTTATLLVSDALGVSAYNGAQALAAVGADGLCFVASLRAVGGAPPRGALLCWSPTEGLVEATAGPLVDAPAISWALGTPSGHVYLPCSSGPDPSLLRACAYHALTRTWAATPAGVTLSYSSFTSHGGRLYFGAAESPGGRPVLFAAPLLLA